ncbi:MAG: TetR/AcrR family transcriptional regulator [Devosia sp.]|uniref:TetR/AcrR family transcriptional regulator n=1 Tax=Devosia sp. TaxID=1871048 RepID=UPI0024C5EFA0|nr:TetR/AcrR family transcriptional regulator [Devosia sp.]UYN99122.1 MAG: TetR/AcrR family transcriptional regulator [Devosia sp.]
MRGPQTRREIVGAADRLFYEAGFAHTSFADIASSVHISRGNFYYHFKSKDEILRAVIAHRQDSTRALLAAWDHAHPAARDRLSAFVRILSDNGEQIMLHGCPVGSLATELAKLMHESREDAVAVFSLFRDWLASQFSALGRAEDAEALALHLLMRSQGVATLFTAYRDKALLAREMAAMERWIDGAVSGEPSCQIGEDNRTCI